MAGAVSLLVVESREVGMHEFLIRGSFVCGLVIIVDSKFNCLILIKTRFRASTPLINVIQLLYCIIVAQTPFNVYTTLILINLIYSYSVH